MKQISYDLCRPGQIEEDSGILCRLERLQNILLTLEICYPEYACHFNAAIKHLNEAFKAHEKELEGNDMCYLEFL